MSTMTAIPVTTVSTAITEKPLLFGRSRSLVGMLCSPADRGLSATRPTVVFLNSGIIHRVGPNRLYVEMARQLAHMGFASLRFDLGGIGDSSIDSTEEGSVLDLVRRDINDAIGEATKLSENGRIILIGLCSGADNALQTAVQDTRVDAVVLLDPNFYQPLSFHLHHYARRLRDPRSLRLLLTGRHPVYSRLAAGLRRRGNGAESRDATDPEASPFLAPAELPHRDEMHNRLRGLVSRGCRMLFVFSGGLEEQYNHRDQFYHVFPDLRRAANLSLEYFGDADHTFSDPEIRRRMVDVALRWVVE